LALLSPMRAHTTVSVFSASTCSMWRGRATSPGADGSRRRCSGRTPSVTARPAWLAANLSGSAGPARKPRRARAGGDLGREEIHGRGADKARDEGDGGARADLERRADLPGAALVHHDLPPAGSFDVVQSLPRAKEQMSVIRARFFVSAGLPSSLLENACCPG
jgi:hypothetical protein